MTDEFAKCPEQGGRLLAKWTSAGASGVVYAVGVADAAGHWESTARVGEDGTVTFQTWRGASEPPEWLTHALHATLRSAWQGRRAGLAWPRRLYRWRPVPDAGDAAEVE